MSRGYQLTAEARANLDEICVLIAEDSVDAALIIAVLHGARDVERLLRNI